MWWSVVLLVASASAELSVRCSRGDEPRVSLTSTPTPGRYVVQYCALVNRNVTRWQLLMSTLSQPAENCTKDVLRERYSGVSHSHSEEEIDLNDLNITCSRACFAKPMDLMFRSCYRLENKLFRGMRSSEPYNSYHFVDNNITEYTRDTTPQFVTDIDYDTTVSFHWFQGHIPITDYEITVWPNDTHTETTVVTSNCTRQAKSVQCILQLPLGCYTLQLKHIAPWTKGFSHLAVYDGDFCHTGTLQPSLLPAGAGGSWSWWAGGAALLLVAAGAAGLALRLSHVAKTNIRKLVRQTWLSSPHEAEKAVVPPPVEGRGCILLLYARDCPAAGRVAHALRDLLNDAAPGQVYDVYSPEVLALCGKSPYAWVRGVLLAPDVRVVLLQTPALAALHTNNLQDNADTLRLEEPLLPRRAVHRSPQFGDNLTQYALQLLGEVVHTQPHPPYRKYFLATVSELPVDLFPTVVPYTRYELPAACNALVLALRPNASASETAIAAITNAAKDLVVYANENPNYLAEHLVFL